MPFDIYSDARRELGDYVTHQAAFGPAPDFGGAFLSSLQANAGSLALLRAGHNSQQLVYDWLDAFEAKTGYRPDPFARALPGDFDYDTLSKAYQTEATSRPGFDLTPPPTREQAWQHAMDIERSFAEADARARGGSQTFGSWLGSNLGPVAAFAADPITILSSGFVGPEAAGILSSAMREAALFGGQQAAISTARYPISTALNPDYGPGNVLQEAGLTALGGAGFGLGLRGLASVWSRLAARDWTRTVMDAGNVVTREAVNTTGDLNAGRSAGAAGQASFASNARAAEGAIAAGRPVEPPAVGDLFPNGTYRPQRVFTSDGKAVDVQYQVVPADSLVTSNRPDLSANPAFPAELQPRDRTRATSADQINAIAARLEPERLGPSADAATGAPIIGPDGVVESGNGRVLALLRAYDAGGPQADSYRAFLTRQGFDVTGIDNPVLVARRITPLSGDERAAFATAANRAVAMRMSAPEQAQADARLLDEATLAKLVEGKGLDTADNRPFVRAFFNQLPKEERGGLVDRAGTLSQEGQGRVQAALLARAYGDGALLARLLESSEAGMKGIGGALTDAAGAWAAMRAAVSRGMVPAQMDLTPDLLAAFRLVETARGQGIKPADLLAQADMFSGNAATSATKALLSLMFRDEGLTKAASRQAVARGLRAYAEEAVKNTTDARLFGEALAPGDVLGTALAKAGREDLAAATEKAVTPEAVEKALAEPVTNDASVHDVEHLLEETPDLMVADPLGTLNPDGTPVMRPVRELLAEADGEIAAAKEIEACASGAMLEAAE